MRKTDTNIPILIPKEDWQCSPLSLARHYGGIDINGKQYLIVNRQGKTVYELSTSTTQGVYAIPAGEPADLVLKSWIPVYKRLGREKVIELIKNHTSLTEAKKIKL